MPFGEVPALVHKARGNNMVASRSVVHMGLRQFQFQLVAAAASQPDTMLGLGIQRQDPIRIHVHPPAELHVAAIFQPLLD